MVKIVSEEVDSFRVKIVVERKTKTVVNPNGRGYDADNTEHFSVSEVLDVTVRATDAEDARNKVEALMRLVNDD